MNELDKFRDIFDYARKKSEVRQYIFGILGKVNQDSTITIAVPNRPKFVYVRIGTEAERQLTIANNDVGIEHRANLPVRMVRENNQLVIRDKTSPTNETSTSTDTSIPSGVSKHTHSIGSGLEYIIESQRLEPGLINPAGGFMVTVLPVRYKYGDTWKTYIGETFDVSINNQPLTTGKWYWALFTIEPITNVLQVFNDAEQNYATPLTQIMLDAISIGNNIPIGAIKVKASDTTINDISRYFDARQWITGNNPNLDHLKDVIITTPGVKHFLYYDTTDSIWKNRTLTSADMSDFNEAAQDSIGTILVDTATIDFTYTDATPTITADVINASITNAKLANMVESTVKGRAAASGTGSPVDLTPAQLATLIGSALTSANLSDFTEAVQDVMGAILIDAGDLDWTYTDASNTLSAIVVNDAITNAKRANMVQSTVSGRAVGAGTGDPTDLTATQLNSIVGSVWLRSEAGVSFHPTVTSIEDGYSINYKNDGSLYPLRIALPDDAANPRHLSVGRYIATVWTPVFDINSQSGVVNIGTPLNFSLLNIRGANGLFLYDNSADYVAIRMRGRDNQHYSRIQWAGDSNTVFAAIVGEQKTPTGAGNPTSSRLYLQTMTGSVLDNTVIIDDKGVAITTTTSRKARLHVSGGNDTGSPVAAAAIALGYSNTGEYPNFINSIHSGGGGASNAIAFYTSDGTAGGVFPTNAIHALTITNGKVGIKTTNPALTLDVVGGCLLGGSMYVSPTDTNTLNGGYNVNAESSFWLNYRGYLDGLTQFRDLYIADGKSSSIAIFKGSTKRFGLGTTSPQGPIHAHDGTGGNLFVTKTAINATPQTIIPDGTGDVTTQIWINYVFIASDGGKAGGAIGIANGSLISWTTGANTLVLEVAASGALTAYRFAGTLTYTIVLDCIWY